MKFIIISKNKNGSYTIKSDIYEPLTFYGYSKKEALKQFRKINNLKYKRLNIIEL